MITQWLVQNGGLWGIIVVALAGVVVYLDRRSTRAFELRIASLETEKAALQKKLDELHSAWKADAQANTRELLQAADKTWQGVTHLHEIAVVLKTGR